MQLQLKQPKGRLANFIQAIWSAQVPLSDTAYNRWLPMDTCSALIFNFTGPLTLDGKLSTAPIIRQTLSKQTHHMGLKPGTRLAGIRFQPGIGSRIFAEPMLEKELSQLYQKLEHIHDGQQQQQMILQWVKPKVRNAQMLPKSLSQALEVLKQQHRVSEITRELNLGQRQLERQFAISLGLTPKQYQRIWRVKNAQDILKSDRQIALADLAAQLGFSDQAHMTREFKHFAKIAPQQYRNKVLS